VKKAEFEKSLYVPPAKESNVNKKYIGDLFKRELLSKVFSRVVEPKIFKTNEKYSEQEKEALNSVENFVLLGRSGTGKTLVAITKMFLLRVCLESKEIQKSIKEMTNENVYLRMIYTTTSPNLIEEVAKYYALMENRFNAVRNEAASNNPLNQTNLKEIENEKAENTEANVIVLPLMKKEIKNHTFADLKVTYSNILRKSLFEFLGRKLSLVHTSNEFDFHDRFNIRKTTFSS